MMSNQMSRLQEQLVDLYLSVKIRSNDEVRITSVYVTLQIDNYNEDLLAKERKKLKEAEATTLIEYIKTSIEILMNMRLEEYSMMHQQ